MLLIPLQERIPCRHCLKSHLTCYCSQIRPFQTQLKVILLQHPLERRKAIGTARMAHLCIENSKLISGREFADHEEVNQIISNPKYHCIVLFPGPHSLNISSHSPQEIRSGFPTGKLLVLFIIDGTWKFAKRMIQRSPNLLRLPQICFTPEKKSEYRIRQQPHPQCVSTIEAVHKILKILDPSVNPDILLDLFRSMVEQQLHFSRMNQKKRTEKNFLPPIDNLVPIN